MQGVWAQFLRAGGEVGGSCRSAALERPNEAAPARHSGNPPMTAAAFGALPLRSVAHTRTEEQRRVGAKPLLIAK